MITTLSPTLSPSNNKENRRRSISAFTLHSNQSFDNNNFNNNYNNNNNSTIHTTINNPKRRSFSANRRSFSLNSTAISNNNQKSIPANSNSNSRPNSTFFSNSQFSSSTPNLNQNKILTKYIDSELIIANYTFKYNDKIDLIIPTIVFKCCDYILNNPPVEGLFRMNGSIKQVNQIESELYKNLLNYKFNSNNLTTVLDVAVILKRWIAKLDDGIITADVSNLLSKIKGNSFNIDYPSEIEDNNESESDNSNSINNNNIPISNDISDNESLIDMTNSINLNDSPIKEVHNGISHIENQNQNQNQDQDTNENLEKINNDIPIIIQPSRNDYKSIYSIALKKLPIENLHLLLYLLNFLNIISREEFSEITKMHASNLAKVFQLNFFKSVDLMTSTKSFSTEDLKFSYLTNEELLTNLILESSIIIDDLSDFIKSELHQIEHIINNKSTNNNNHNINATNTNINTNITSNISHSISFASSLFIKKRNVSNSSNISTFSNNSTNSSFDYLPRSLSRTKDMNNLLEPCVEKDLLPSLPSTPIIINPRNSMDTITHSDSVIVNDSIIDNKNNVEAPAVSIVIDNVDKQSINTNVNTNINNNTTTNNINNVKRRSFLSGIFNKRKSSISDGRHEKPVNDFVSDEDRENIDESEEVVNEEINRKKHSDAPLKYVPLQYQNDTRRQLKNLNPSQTVENNELDNDNANAYADKSKDNTEIEDTSKIRKSSKRFSLFKFMK